MTNRPKKVQHAPRLCACGCGERPRNWSAKYVAGHKPLRPLAERLWARTEKREGGCWIWTGYVRASSGYGQIGRGRAGEGVLATHRAAWEVVNGPIPDGLVVRHKCDVRACVNPDHLELGTQADNIQDAVKRGRIARGRRLPQSKLTEADVREIRRRYVRGNGAELCEEFGISQPHLSGIVNGKEWKWVE